MEKFFNDFFVAISPALQTLLLSVLTAAAGMFTAWLKSKYNTEKAKLSGEQQYLLSLVVSGAVNAAAQVKEDNFERLEYAFNIAEKALSGYGITIDIDVLYAAIEARVYSNKEAAAFMDS